MYDSKSGGKDQVINNLLFSVHAVQNFKHIYLKSINENTMTRPTLKKNSQNDLTVVVYVKSVLAHEVIWVIEISKF